MPNICFFPFRFNVIPHTQADLTAVKVKRIAR